MNKWYGKIGYSITQETEPGIWEPTIIDKNYFGDIISFRQSSQGSDVINEDLIVQNSISIISDQFANDNIGNMVYLEFMDAKWKIKSVEVKYPRLILSIGGIYNEE